MPPDPDPAVSPVNPDDFEYFSEMWLDLDWSPWVPFDAPREYFYIPKSPGVYRIRPAGKDVLLYIGETGQSLHKKISELRQSLRRGDLMPWTDPHAEAPALWAYWVEWAAEGGNVAVPEPSPVSDEGVDVVETVPMLECSAAPLDASAAGRKGMAAFLLFLYRQERRESPVCNFGRFPPRYRKSSTRKENRRGGKLGDDHRDNPAGWPGTEPLEVVGKPGDRDWMGLEWTDWQPLDEEMAKEVAAGAGLYLLADAGSHDIVYIGQSEEVMNRLIDLTKKSWDGRALLFSYQIIGQAVLPHHLKELENDLIGNYYDNFRKAPEFQYRATGR